MKASVGNYFKSGNGIYEVIATGISGELMLRATNNHDFVIEKDETAIVDPIPLTPQWLLAAGFEKISNDVYSIPLPNGNGVDLVLEWGDCCIKRNHVGKEKKDGDKNPYDYAYIKAPKYVHQLQNLYHALTGQEIQFDLTKIEKG